MNKRFNYCVKFFLVCSIILSSCKKENLPDGNNGETKLFTLLNSSFSGITFTNTSIETPESNLWHYDYFYNGSGVAIGDINNDGLQDVFFAGNDATNKLYVNKGDFKFEDISKTAGIESTTWSTGVTLVDINEDGFQDIYVCNSGPYVDNDRLANKLYINNGDETFTEQASLYGINDSSYSSQAAFFDMDKDGDLDLFVMNHSLITYEKQIHKWDETLMNMDDKIREKSYSKLYRNNGNNSFTDITKESGIYKPGFGLGLVITDFDENGFLDIYVANDYFIPDFLFFNQGDGTFVDDIASKVSHSSFFSMGCDAADVNNDGLIDLVVADMTPADHYRSKTLMESMDIDKFKFLTEHKKYVPQYMYNTFNINRGKGNFSEIGHLSGIAQTDWSWATLLADFDNDAWKDLVITNGFKRDTKNRDWINELNKRYENEGVTGSVVYDQLQKSESTPLPNYVFKNTGGLKFKDVSKKWGFDALSFSQGAAYGDLDNDGDLDIVVNNLENEAFVFRNNSNELKKNYIQFTLSDGNSTNKVLHSKLKVYSGSELQVIEYSFVRGYLSTMQSLAHFGLGDKQTIDKVEVHWPDGSITSVDNPEINKKHHIDKKKYPSNTTNSTLDLAFIDVAERIGLHDYVHIENKFDDFQNEVLLPHKQSTLGPCIAVGDINGDGLDDLYVGGAKGQAGKLFYQDLKRGFVPMDQPAIKTDNQFEDLGALFFDADGDGDLDLYVASGGGGDIAHNKALLQDRLYFNSGFGSFSKSTLNLPRIESSTKSVTANDYDNDGDLDLFVGGRNTPGEYPISPESFLLENTNGTFKDVTNLIAPDLKNIGMITSSIWSDINSDGLEDLIVVGEWMPITIFINSAEGFKNKTEEFGLATEIGWFYSINKGDFDQDGDDDFIVGNLGENNKFQPSKDKPLHIYANDFDDSGSLDIVLSKMYKGNLAPVRGKECSTEQMPFIGEKFPMFSEFASSTLEDIYGAEKLESAIHFQASNFSSFYLENDKGSFKLSKLPLEAQIAPIMGSVIHDFNRDGDLDVVIGGNMFNTEVETPSYDAGKGLFLKGNGDGTFETSLLIEDSGIFMPQNVKNLELVFLFKEKRPAILVANNDSVLNLIVWVK